MNRVTYKDPFGNWTVDLKNEVGFHHLHGPHIDRLAAYENMELTPDEFQEAVDGVLELNKRLRPFFEAFASTCKYPFEIPGIGMCCDAYSRSKRPDGRHWANYPECEAKNCPLLYPELLGDAKL